MNNKNGVLYLLLCFSFASTLTAGKIAILNGVSPFALAAFRFSLGSIILVIYFSLKKVITINHKPGFKLSKNNIYKISILSIFMFIIPFSCIINALVFIPSGIAGIIGSSIPLFTMIFSHFMFNDERFTKKNVLGLTLGTTGLIILALSGTKKAFNIEFNNFIKGFVLYITGCVSVGLGNVFSKKLNPGTNVSYSTLFQAIIASIFFISMTFIFENPLQIRLKTKIILPIIYVSVFGMSLSYVIYYTMLVKIGPVKMSTITLIVPVFAVVLGYLMLNEKININILFSGAFVISGVGFILFTQNIKKEQIQPK